MNLIPQPCRQPYSLWVQVLFVSLLQVFARGAAGQAGCEALRGAHAGRFTYPRTWVLNTGAPSVVRVGSGLLVAPLANGRDGMYLFPSQPARSAQKVSLLSEGSFIGILGAALDGSPFVVNYADLSLRLLDSLFRTRESFRLPLQPSDIAVDRTFRAVASGVIASPAGVGFPLHAWVLGREQLARSFGSSRTSVPAPGRSGMARILAIRYDGVLAAGDRATGVVEFFRRGESAPFRSISLWPTSPRYLRQSATPFLRAMTWAPTGELFVAWQRAAPAYSNHSTERILELERSRTVSVDSLLDGVLTIFSLGDGGQKSLCSERPIDLIRNHPMVVTYHEMKDSVVIDLTDVRRRKPSNRKRSSG